MRKKLNKPILGFIGLILVAIMTIIAYFIPTQNAVATDNTTVTNILKVTVYENYPSVTINSPKADNAIANQELSIDVFYENLDYIDFFLSYVNEDGDTIEIPLPRYTPTSKTGESIAAGEDTIRVNLRDYNLGYNTYVLTARAYSSLGYAEDTISFSYVPASLSQSDETNDDGDPIITIDYDEGVEKFEVMIYDDLGNPIFDEPIVYEIPSPFSGGTKDIELLLSSYGLPSGRYYAVITAYKSIDAYDINGNPILDENGRPVKILTPIDAPSIKYVIHYQAPDAPDVPVTSGVLEKYNIDPYDYFFTLLLLFILLALIALYTIYKRRQKNYRVYYKKNSKRR